VTLYTPKFTMTHLPDLFTPNEPDPLDTHGVVEIQDNHYAVTCGNGCGARKACPADVGRSTAECTLRYAGWRRGKDKRWRCGRCLIELTVMTPPPKALPA
jgi:hypothetical protein